MHNVFQCSSLQLLHTSALNHPIALAFYHTSHYIRATGQSTIEIITIAGWNIKVNSVCMLYTTSGISIAFMA